MGKITFTASEQPTLPESSRRSVFSSVGLRERVFGGAGGKVFRGMATLAAGSFAARLIGIATIPILTRIYGPEDYGALAVFIALVAMLAPVFTLRYVVAVPLPRHDGMAMNLMVLSAGLMVAMAIIVGLLLWAFAPALLGLVSMESLVRWWWLIVIGLLGAGIYELLTTWAIRERAYKPIAQTEIIQSALGAATKTILGLAGVAPLGLLVGQVVTQGGGIFSLSRIFGAQFRKNIGFVSASRLRLVAGRYRGFPIYRLPSQFLMAFSQQAPLMFAAALYDAHTVGQLGLALMALALPVNLLGNSISNAYYAEIAKIKKDHRTIQLITLSVQKRLFAISAPISIIFFLFGEEVFKIGFGPDWKEAGKFASILSIYMMMQFTSAPLIKVLNIYDKQLYFFIINVCRVVFLIVILLCSGYFGFQASEFVWIIGIFLSIFYLIITVSIFFMLIKLVPCEAES